MLRWACAEGPSLGVGRRPWCCVQQSWPLASLYSVEIPACSKEAVAQEPTQRREPRLSPFHTFPMGRGDLFSLSGKSPTAGRAGDRRQMAWRPARLAFDNGPFLIDPSVCVPCINVQVLPKVGLWGTFS